ncbi:MAG: histidine phosphatase family protein [Verrucomicrobiota bacterium]
MSASPSKNFRRKRTPAPATRLLLIRHAEVEVAHQRTFGGQIDMNLSLRGKRQAKQLAGYLHSKTLDAIYASPMKRVQQTLAPTLKNSAPAQIILPELREIDFGDWTGLGWETVKNKFSFAPHEWLDQIERHGAPNGESGRDFRARVEPCLREIIRQHPGQNIAVFCHGGVIRMILAILLGLPLPKTNLFEIEYASITQVALHPHMAEVELLNFTPWRDLVA